MKLRVGLDGRDAKRVLTAAIRGLAYARAGSADGGGADLQFAPQHIAVTAEIDARSVASRPAGD